MEDCFNFCDSLRKAEFYASYIGYFSKIAESFITALAALMDPKAEFYKEKKNHLLMGIQTRQLPFIKAPFALSHMLIGLILLYANIYPGTANAKIGPITDPTRQKTHGPTRIEHQSKT